MPIDNHGRPSRVLPFPLKNPIEYEQSDEALGDVISPVPDFFPVDADERIDVKFNMSFNEFTSFASSIDVGRDIAYGENSYLVWWNWLRALIGVATVDCDDVADCIETSETVQSALLVNQTTNLNAGGYTPNQSTTPTVATETMPTSQASENLAVELDECEDHARNMAVARAIVKELHETTTDFFETLEYATNATEAAGIVVGAIPAAGTGAALLEMANWIQDTVAETYAAAYNQSSEDEIACAIYCHIEAECEISLNSLLDIYEGLGSITVPEITTYDDLINFIVTTTMGIDVTGVAIFHYFILRSLKFGGVVFEMAGFNDLANVIRTASSYQDFSYDQCLDCPPEDTPTLYWKMYLDFRLSQWGTIPVVWNGGQNDGSWAGDGWYWNVTTASTTNVSFGVVLSGAFVLKAVATQSVRRGSDGSGSNDIAGNTAWTNANFTGTSANFGQTGINVDGNDIRAGNIVAGNVTAYQSINNRSRVQETANLPTTYLRVYSMVIWGIPNVGNIKPVGSVWAGNTLPATISDLFPVAP
jgi:hypothetical protein